MWKPLPCVSYQSDHPLLSDRDCEAAEGHSQPVAACGDAATFCHWLYTKHPQLVQSPNPCEGGYLLILYRLKFPVLHKHGWACNSRWLDFLPPVLSNLPGRQPWFCYNKTVLRIGTLCFRSVVGNIKMPLSLIDFVSADQQNALKVVRASKPRTRKSSKVIVLSFSFFICLSLEIPNSNISW